MNEVLKYRLDWSDSGQFTGGLFLKRRYVSEFHQTRDFLDNCTNINLWRTLIFVVADSIIIYRLNDVQSMKSKKRNDYNKILLKALVSLLFQWKYCSCSWTLLFEQNWVTTGEVRFLLSTVFAILPYLQRPHLLSSYSESQEVLIP